MAKKEKTKRSKSFTDLLNQLVESRQNRNVDLEEKRDAIRNPVEDLPQIAKSELQNEANSRTVINNTSNWSIQTNEYGYPYVYSEDFQEAIPEEFLNDVLEKVPQLKQGYQNIRAVYEQNAHPTVITQGEDHSNDTPYQQKMREQNNRYWARQYEQNTGAEALSGLLAPLMPSQWVSAISRGIQDKSFLSALEGLYTGHGFKDLNSSALQGDLGTAANFVFDILGPVAVGKVLKGSMSVTDGIAQALKNSNIVNQIKLGTKYARQLGYLGMNMPLHILKPEEAFQLVKQGVNDKDVLDYINTLSDDVIAKAAKDAKFTKKSIVNFGTHSASDRVANALAINKAKYPITETPIRDLAELKKQIASLESKAKTTKLTRSEKSQLEKLKTQVQQIRGLKRTNAKNNLTDEQLIDSFNKNPEDPIALQLIKDKNLYPLVQSRDIYTKLATGKRITEAERQLIKYEDLTEKELQNLKTLDSKNGFNSAGIDEAIAKKQSIVNQPTTPGSTPNSTTASEPSPTVQPTTEPVANPVIEPLSVNNPTSTAPEPVAVQEPTNPTEYTFIIDTPTRSIKLNVSDPNSTKAFDEFGNEYGVVWQKNEYGELTPKLTGEVKIDKSQYNRLFSTNPNVDLSSGEVRMVEGESRNKFTHPQDFFTKPKKNKRGKIGTYFLGEKARPQKVKPTLVEYGDELYNLYSNVDIPEHTKTINWWTTAPALGGTGYGLYSLGDWIFGKDTPEEKAAKLKQEAQEKKADIQEAIQSARIPIYDFEGELADTVSININGKPQIYAIKPTNKIDPEYHPDSNIWSGIPITIDKDGIGHIRSDEPTFFTKKYGKWIQVNSAHDLATPDQFQQVNDTTNMDNSLPAVSMPSQPSEQTPTRQSTPVQRQQPVEQNTDPDDDYVKNDFLKTLFNNTYYV